jgi:hypothetical protein
VGCGESLLCRSSSKFGIRSLSPTSGLVRRRHRGLSISLHDGMDLVDTKCLRLACLSAHREKSLDPEKGLNPEKDLAGALAGKAMSIAQKFPASVFSSSSDLSKKNCKYYYSLATAHSAPLQQTLTRTSPSFLRSQWAFDRNWIPSVLYCGLLEITTRDNCGHCI